MIKQLEIDKKRKKYLLYKQYFKNIDHRKIFDLICYQKIKMFIN